MNSVILNNKSSNEFNGLIIQELPSIVKPQMRVRSEEIEGRDGDLIEELGYAAYDKELQIGLYNDYDIDEIIKFFTSSGIVTFSNEVDKYYRYKIVEEIEFKRLVRFRTASVIFHVQPFKYSTIEEKKIFNISTEKSIKIKNTGNIYSKPIINFTGTGIVDVSLNGYQIFKIDFGGVQQTIEIDCEKLEAYNPVTKQLKNRSVTGNYDKFKLLTGINEISFSGNLNSIEIDNYSRWI